MFPCQDREDHGLVKANAKEAPKDQISAATDTFTLKTPTRPEDESEKRGNERLFHGNVVVHNSGGQCSKTENRNGESMKESLLSILVYFRRKLSVFPKKYLQNALFYLRSFRLTDKIDILKR